MSSSANGTPEVKFPLYHVTSQVYERPTWEGSRDFLYSPAARWENGTHKHANGILGLWASPYPERCMGFGPHVAKVDFHEDYRPIVMPLKQLMGFHIEMDEDLDQFGELEAYQDIREQLLPLGDVLFVGDAHGIGEVVVLNYEVIENFEYGHDHKGRESNNQKYPIPASFKESYGSRMVHQVKLKIPDEAFPERQR